MIPSTTYANSIQRTPRQYRRPASIAELAHRAQDGLYDETRDLKHYLRNAEKYRRTAKELLKAGDTEAAFVEFAKAATLVLEKLPTHRDYHTLLTSEQRHNLGLNGQDMLDSLSDLKPSLVERYERWLAAHPDALEENSTRPPSMPRSKPRSASVNRDEDSRQRNDSDPRQRQNGYYSRSSQDDTRRAQAQAEARLRVQEEALRKREQERRVAEELDLLRQQRQQSERYVEGLGRSSVGGSAGETAAEIWRREEAARQRNLDLTFSRRQDPVPGQNPHTQRSQPDELRSNIYAATAQAPHRRQEETRLTQQEQQQQQYQHQQEEMRRREEDISRRRMEERRKAEQDGISKRQHEAEAAARAERHNVSNPPSSSSAVPSQYQAQMPVPTTVSTVRAPKAVSSRPASFLDTYPDALPMPLESPTRYEGDSTDSEAVGDGLSSVWRHVRGGKQNNGAPSRAPPRSPLYPPPITTTSPPPSDHAIRYPEIMSLHQKSQGYVPSLHSMFNPTMKLPTVPSSLLFEADPQSTSTQSSHAYLTNHNSHTLYPSNMLPQPSAPVQRSQPQYPYGSSTQSQQQQQQQSYPHQQQQVQYPGPPRTAVPVPTPSAGPPPPNSAPPLQRSDSSRIIRSTSIARPADPVIRELKTVNLPRECLQRFLSIAALNTSRNRETCGLLLGKDKEKKYVVTTLLIPKQHSTSDTCTMDEEELVLQFTEERSLITLGWIHTHPSQSCFMSSVDLHTHSGFQRMLPESFAVVCAPKSNPNFGIFRLTDPPGLQTILDCNAKEAFHPHPDVPIYTDADKGHVQMKDISLEIVDLR